MIRNCLLSGRDSLGPHHFFPSDGRVRAQDVESDLLDKFDHRHLGLQLALACHHPLDAARGGKQLQAPLPDSSVVGVLSEELFE